MILDLKKADESVSQFSEANTRLKQDLQSAKDARNAAEMKLAKTSALLEAATENIKAKEQQHASLAAEVEKLRGQVREKEKQMVALKEKALQTQLQQEQKARAQEVHLGASFLLLLSFFGVLWAFSVCVPHASLLCLSSFFVS